MRQNKSLLQDNQKQPAEQELAQSRIRRRFDVFYNRFKSIFLVCVSIILTLSIVMVINAFQPPPQRLTQRDIDNAVVRSLETMKPKPSYTSLVYEIIHPSLVRIHAFTVKDVENEDIDISLGTGVVIDESGIILTSLHVVKDVDRISVEFADGFKSDAVIVGTQPENDLAVLLPEVIPDDLKPATLSSSSSLSIGDEVVAVGNPFGLSNSLSAGVVSGLGRNFESRKTGEKLTNLIQFDAAANPGNSGGPLLDRNGEIVGIVTGLLNPIDEEFFIGIAFAVPMRAQLRRWDHRRINSQYSKCRLPNRGR
jgi:S1-C subfamily serine protease